MMHERSTAYEHITVAMQEQRYSDAERTATRLVKQEPLNPQGWVFLAEALMQQGFIETASKVFERAWLLDPEADWVKSVYALLAVLKDNVPRFDIEALLKLPAVTVTAVVLAQDDGQALQRCLASLHGTVDEVIVVDIGSTDAIHNMLAQCAHMPLQYLDCRQETDLLTAHNESLQHITSDWVLFVQENEYLFRQDQTVIRHIASLYHRVYPPAVLKVGRECIDPFEASPIAYTEDRMFPMGHGFRFWSNEGSHTQIGDQAGPFEDHARRRPVRIRFGIEVNEQHHIQRLLLAAKQNLLKSKQLVTSYRGAASVDRHIAAWKADQLLFEIAKYVDGDPK